jgi:Uma2 family endonuclease
MASEPKTLLTAEQYLEIERKAERKSEFHDGEMFAMAGASRVHNRLVWNLIVRLGSQLGAGPCQGFPSDMHVRVAATGLYTYPDVVVVCGKPEFLDGHTDTLLNPTLIVEVLSASTEAYDRGRKFEHYRSLPSLRQYLVVASELIGTELRTRRDDDHWLMSFSTKAEDVIDLHSVGARLLVSEIYAGVEIE